MRPSIKHQIERIKALKKTIEIVDSMGFIEDPKTNPLCNMYIDFYMQLRKDLGLDREDNLHSYVKIDSPKSLVEALCLN